MFFPKIIAFLVMLCIINAVARFLPAISKERRSKHEQPDRVQCTEYCEVIDRILSCHAFVPTVWQRCYDEYNGITVLDVAKVPFPSIRKEDFLNMPGLTHIYLDDIRVRMVYEDSFKQYESLQLLSLRHIGTDVSKFLPAITKLGGRIWYVDISGNFKNCNCQYVEFVTSLVNVGTKIVPTGLPDCSKSDFQFCLEVPQTTTTTTLSPTAALLKIINGINEEDIDKMSKLIFDMYAELHAPKPVLVKIKDDNSKNKPLVVMLNRDGEKQHVVVQPRKKPALVVAATAAVVTSFSPSPATHQPLSEHPRTPLHWFLSPAGLITTIVLAVIVLICCFFMIDCCVNRDDKTPTETLYRNYSNNDFDDVLHHVLCEDDGESQNVSQNNPSKSGVNRSNSKKKVSAHTVKSQKR